MKPIIQEDKFYTISTANGEILEVADTSRENGGIIRLYNDWYGKPRPWQLWRFEKVSDYDDYRIINKLSGKAIDVIGGSAEAGAWLHQWEKTGGYSQVWYITQNPDGTFKIMNVPNGKVLDIVGMVPEDFARLQIWDDVDGENQKWTLTEINPDTYEAIKLTAPEAEVATEYVASAEDVVLGEGTAVTLEKTVEEGKPETETFILTEEDSPVQTLASVTFEEPEEQGIPHEKVDHEDALNAVRAKAPKEPIHLTVKTVPKEEKEPEIKQAPTAISSSTTVKEKEEVPPKKIAATKTTKAVEKKVPAAKETTPKTTTKSEKEDHSPVVKAVKSVTKSVSKVDSSKQETKSEEKELTDSKDAVIQKTAASTKAPATKTAVKSKPARKTSVRKSTNRKKK